MNRKVLRQNFAQILKEKRTELNCSQEKMAEICHLSARGYPNLENAKSLPKFETLIYLITVLDIDFNEYIKSMIEIGAIDGDDD